MLLLESLICVSRVLLFRIHNQLKIAQVEGPSEMMRHFAVEILESRGILSLGVGTPNVLTPHFLQLYAANETTAP